VAGNKADGGMSVCVYVCVEQEIWLSVVSGGVTMSPKGSHASEEWGDEWRFSKGMANWV